VLVALAAITVSAWGQTPVVSRVVNSASYQPTFGSPGSIASIFGANLAATTAAAQAVPLPFELGGTSVTVLGQAVPLYYVSPVQINFQVPNAGVVDLVVSTAAGTSQPYGPPDNAWNEAGVFTMDESGCGQGAVLNMAADGSLSRSTHPVTALRRATGYPSTQPGSRESTRMVSQHRWRPCWGKRPGRASSSTSRA